MTAIRVPYSQAQADAFLDSCLYGLSYGIEYGEREYIAEYLKSRVLPVKYARHEMDDKNLEHIITY